MIAVYTWGWQWPVLVILGIVGGLVFEGRRSH